MQSVARLFFSLAAGAACLLPGCAGVRDRPVAAGATPGASTRGLATPVGGGVLADQSPAGPVGSPFAAVVDGREIAWDSLRPALAEAAGGLILEEAALDAIIELQLKSAGLSVSDDDAAAERRTLAAAISRDARADAEEAERLLASLRASRGLGPTRFAAMLKRNAGLRALVRHGESPPSVDEADLQRLYRLRFGTKTRARVILVPTERQAAEVREQLADGGPDLLGRFAAAAVRASTDPSGPRGGMLDPISADDATYPAAVRAALAATEPGQLTPVVAADRGYAVLLVEERMAAQDEAFESVADALRTEAIEGRERQAMDELARRLLTAARVTPADPSLSWSWRARVQRGR